jgi:DNA-binding LacI/PurR family transcriptional regulator
LHGVYLDLVQCSTETYLHKAELEAEHLNYVLKHGFGGVVFFPQACNSNRELLRKVARRVPLVLLDRQMPGVQADFVGTENRWSTLEATRHLINQGHKRVAFLTSGEFSIKAQERLEGYFQALNDAFSDDPYEMILTPPLRNSLSWPMFEAICRLPEEKRPTGIVCSSNHEAVRAASYLRALNIRVPEDVSLVGFDDIGRTLCSSLELTAAEQPFEIGKAAAKLILRRCQDPSIDLAHIELPASLVAHDVNKTH